MLRSGAGRRRSPDQAGAAGFTLVELVISVAILGIVMTAFAAIISTSLLVSAETEQRLDSSNALRRIGITFTTDVASSVEVKTDSAGCAGSGDVLLELRGRTFNEPPVATPPVEPAPFLTAVTYEFADGVLTRRVCRNDANGAGAGAAATTLVESEQLAEGLSEAVADCEPGCDDPNATYSLVLTPSDGTAQTLSATRRTS